MRGSQLVIVNPRDEQEPFRHPHQDGSEMALHWDGIGPRLGSHSAWVSLIELHPRQVSTLHVHPEHDETFVVVSGVGIARELEGEGFIDHPIRALDMVYAPRGVAKQIENSGGDPLVLVQVYAPAPSVETIAETIATEEHTVAAPAPGAAA